MGSLTDQFGTDDEEVPSNGSEQNKSLLAHVYSTDGSDDPDPYKQIDDWNLSSEAIQLAYALCAPGGSNQEEATLDQVFDVASSGSGGKEEFFNELVLAIGHLVDEYAFEDGVPEIQRRDIESQGATPIIELLFGENSRAQIFADYLNENPEFAEEVKEAMGQSDEAEATPADD